MAGIARVARPATRARRLKIFDANGLCAYKPLSGRMNEMIADSAEIKFECSQCGQSLSVDSSAAGITTNCPTCESPVVIPQLHSIHDRHYGEAPPMESSREDFAAAELLELREELAEAHSAAAHSERRAVAVERQLGEAREKISQTAAALADEEENRAQWEAACAQAGERADFAAAELVETRAQLAECAAALTVAQEETGAMQAAGAELRGQLESALAQLQDAAATRAALAAAEENLAAKQRGLETTEAELQTLSNQCAALRQEADTLRRDLSEIHTGRELLELRARFLVLETDHQRTTGTLGRIEAEAKTLTASEQQLRAELTETRDRAAAAERRAEAASESAVSKDNEVLRGIIDRQKAVIEESFTELRRLRRARLFLRILYAVIALLVIGLAALAVDYLPDAVKAFLHEWFGIH